MTNKETWANMAWVEDNKAVIGFDFDLKSRVMLTKDELSNLICELLQFMNTDDDGLRRLAVDANLSRERKRIYPSELKSVKVAAGLVMQADKLGNITISLEK